LNEKSSGSGLENRDYRPWKFVALTTQHPIPAIVGTNFADKGRSLGRYGSLAEYGHGVFLVNNINNYNWRHSLYKKT
jgi:hypothetical protein